MTQQYWWERYPARLRDEFEALNKAGVAYSQDQAALAKGVMRLDVDLTLGGRTHHLFVIFPDLYPYFRFEIYAPELDLPHHQNPFGKNLCLLGRPTDQWNTSDMLAAFLTERLPRVLQAGESTDREEVAGLEMHQAEPISDYYVCAEGSSIVIDGQWAIGPLHTSGKLCIGLEPIVWPALRGAVLEVHGEGGEILAEADRSLRELYSAQFVFARWVRLNAPPKQRDPDLLYADLEARDQQPSSPFAVETDGGRLEIRAALFREEVGWWQRGDGWAFACRLESNRPGRAAEGAESKNVAKESVPVNHCLAKVFRAGPEDLAARVPELRPLRTKTIAVFGVGCLGAPSVFEFARAGARCLRFVDYDVADPATAVRWPLGFAVAGLKKVNGLHSYIRRNYPFTRSEPFDLKIGTVRERLDRPSDQAVIEQVTRGADLIYDTTTELGVQNYLTDYARAHSLTYIGVSGTLGAWGGKVFRIRPQTGSPCWYCYRQACDDGTIPEPPSAPDQEGTVQPIGCADPTFTGAGFDMLQVALMGVRMAVSTLCEGSSAYPSYGSDVVHMRFRDSDGGLITPMFQAYDLTTHEKCPLCHGRPA